MEIEEKQKNNNKILIILIVILLLVVVSLGGYVVYDKVISKTDDKDVKTELEKQEKEKGEQETVLTQNEKDEISTKTSQILFLGRIYTEPVYVPKDDECHNQVSFVKKTLDDGFISDGNKALLALSMAQGVKVNDSRNKKNEEEVRKIYKNYFGNDWKNIDVSNVSLCPSYSYDATNKVFYEDMGCGGTSGTQVIVHKENYVLKGDTATVDIYLATMVSDLNNSDIAYVSSELEPRIDNLDKSKVLTTVNSANSYTLTDTDKTKVNKYVVSFKKAADGSFYFSSINK